MFSSLAKNLSKASTKKSNFASIVGEILYAAAPALCEQGKPEDYFNGVYLRLLHLIKLALTDKDKFELTVTHTHQAFGIKTSEQQKHFNQLFIALSKEIIHAASEQSISTNEFVEKHLLFEEAVPALKFMMEKYKQTLKPEVLVEAQSTLQKAIDSHPTIKNATRRIQAKESDNWTSHDNLFYIDNRCYSLPGGYKLYADNGWVPPQQFVNDIMQGGDVFLKSQSWGGLGGYIHGIKIPFNVLERMKHNTATNRLHFHSVPYELDEKQQIEHYCVGYLFGVKTPDNKEYDIDTHGSSVCCIAHDDQIQYGEGTIVHFGQVMYQGKDVTSLFWERVHGLVGIRKETDEKAYKFANEANIPRQYVFTKVKLNPYSSYHFSNFAPDIYLTTKLIFSNKSPRMVDGLNSIIPKRRKNETVLDQKIVAHLVRLTGAIKGLEYKRPPIRATIEVEKPKDLNPSCHDQKTSAAYHGHLEGDYYTDDGLYKSVMVSPYSVERALGRQGKFIDKSLSFSHTQLEFANKASLEKGIKFLLDQRLISAFDMIVKGNTLYLQGHVNIDAVLALDKVNTFTIEDAKHDETVESHPKVAEMTASSSANPEAVLTHALVPVGLQDKFNINYSKETDKFQMTLRVPESKANKATQNTVADIFHQAFQTLQGVAKDKGATMEIKQSDTMVLAELNHKGMIDLSTALSSDKNSGRLIGNVLVELHAANELLRKSDSPNYNVKHELETLAVLSNFLLPTDDLAGHHVEVINNTLNKQLEKAVLANQIFDIEELVKLGADPSFAMNVAASTESVNVETLACLLKLKANPEGKKTLLEEAERGGTSYYETPLIRAASKGNLAKVKLLVENGADMGTTSGSNNAFVKSAIFGGNPEVSEFLLEKGGVHTVDEYGKPVKDIDQILMYIDRFKDEKATISLLDKLVARGADVNFKAFQSPLRNSFRHRDEKTHPFDSALTKRFIEFGAQLTMDDIQRETWVIAYVKQHETFKKILPSVNSVDHYGYKNTIFHNLLESFLREARSAVQYFELSNSILMKFSLERAQEIKSLLFFLTEWPDTGEKIDISIANENGKTIADLLNDVKALQMKVSSQSGLFQNPLADLKAPIEKILDAFKTSTLVKEAVKHTK